MPNDLLAGPENPTTGRPTYTGEWDVDRLDLDAYLRRIASAGPLKADGHTLAALHRAHIAAIPFENLDVILGRGVAVDLEHVQAKLVARGRGGYCYEHATLFGAVLERLGYQVDRLLARTGDPVDHPRPRSHMVLRVATRDEQWLADVGFGSGLLAPVPLAADGPHSQGAWKYELLQGPDAAWRLREFDGADWTTILTFTEEPQHFIDIDVANYNTATNPHSPFVQRPIVVRKDDTTVRRLIGREYTVEQPGEPARQRHLTDDEFAAALRTEFGGALATEEVSALVVALPPEGTTALPAQVPAPASAPASAPAQEDQAARPICQLAIVIASVRKDRIGPTVARWLHSQVRAGIDAPVDIIDLAHLDLPHDLDGGADTDVFTKRIESADAIIVVTPEYNRGYPGALKTAIDTAVSEWRAKPVGFVSYGGISGGLRAVEQLRTVFAELHVVTMQASVSLSFVWDQFDEEGRLRQPERAASAAGTMLRQLAWWARALRDARTRQPYDG